jgi:hypothetical protein
MICDSAGGARFAEPSWGERYLLNPHTKTN